jgi:hypothetical protein
MKVHVMDAALEAEAIRLYRRYQVEIVEGLNLCPWAQRARLDGRVRERVLGWPCPDLAEPLEAMDTMAHDRGVDIGLLIFPTATITLSDFERFVSRLVHEDAKRWELGTAPFALAAFHPVAEPDLSDAERLIAFLRRTPDPTIQLVRCEILDDVRKGFSDGTAFVDINFLSTLDQSRENTLPLRERIARANLRTVGRVGVADVERRLASIRDDRARAYAALGVA